MMRRRVKSARSDKKRFSRTGARTHKKNFRAGPMRGGIRL